MVASESTRRAEQRTVTLPGGLRVACQTVTEARFFYHDIFEKRIYHRGGISLEGVEVVFDVGANIGLFTLFVRRFCPRATVFAFEPVPALYEILHHNVSAHATLVRPFNCAIADRSGRAPLTFYPNSSGMSSLYADREEERRALAGIFGNELRQGKEGLAELMRHEGDLLEERLRTEIVEVELRTLSEVVREHGVERIDLLKIDVQKAEADVIAGIEERDWPKIRQMVVEVHDVDGRLGQLRRQLEARGFTVAAEQDDPYEGSTVFNLYAVRGARPAATGARRGLGARAASLRAALQRQEQDEPAVTDERSETTP